MTPGPEATEPLDLVWYVSFGSNMSSTRFACYVSGGTPFGGARTCPGCRDEQPPRATRPVWLAGGTYFALQSRVWGGGMALYDPDLPETAPGRAYLITAAQFSDVAAQEMHRQPGEDLDLSNVIDAGRAQLGPGRYETLLCPDWLEGYPLLTFTASWRLSEVTPTAPAAAYLRMLGEGLQESHGWSIDQTASYLANRPGARGTWSAEEISAVLKDEE